MKTEAKSSGAIALAISGIASAFAFSACCALPILLAGAGFTTYWLAPFGAAGSHFRTPLTILAALCLAGSTFIVLRSAKTCQPGDLYARSWLRGSILAAAAFGIMLLIVSKLYA